MTRIANKTSFSGFIYIGKLCVMHLPSGRCQACRNLQVHFFVERSNPLRFSITYSFFIQNGTHFVS